MVLKLLIIMILLQVNKEKGQALVEFLTPEDASAALNFDGKSFSGNIVRIRRPKDYVEAKASVRTIDFTYDLLMCTCCLSYLLVCQANNTRFLDL